MKIDNLKSEHLSFLKVKYNELYNKKFPWADGTLIESMIIAHVNKVVAEIDEEEYLAETQLESLELK